MPDIHVGLVELGVLIGSIVLSFGTVRWQTKQNSSSLSSFKKEHETYKTHVANEFNQVRAEHKAENDKMYNKMDDLGKNMVTLISSLSELKGQLSERFKKR